jgi:hypothetical protein
MPQCDKIKRGNGYAALKECVGKNYHDVYEHEGTYPWTIPQCDKIKRGNGYAALKEFVGKNYHDV